MIVVYVLHIIPMPLPLFDIPGSVLYHFPVFELNNATYKSEEKVVINLYIFPSFPSNSLNATDVH